VAATHVSQEKSIMKKGRTSLNQSEAVWWQAFRRRAEEEAWKDLQTLFPRLKQFEAPSGRFHSFKFQGTQQKVGRYGK
jgi:hypothetical protein